jgi:Fe-S-cluster containining protein
MRDPVVWKEPDLIVRHGARFEIRREGSRCAALKVAAPERYACTIYENRPRPCREFAAGGRHCLDARRRVGLSAFPAARPAVVPEA